MKWRVSGNITYEWSTVVEADNMDDAQDIACDRARDAADVREYSGNNILDSPRQGSQYSGSCRGWMLMLGSVVLAVGFGWLKQAISWLDAQGGFTQGIVLALVLSIPPLLIKGAVIAWKRVQQWRGQKRVTQGRKGLLNVRVDVPKAMVAQDRRLNAIAGLIGRIDPVLKRANDRVNPDSFESRVATANKVAAAIGPIARKMRIEAEGFRAETTEFSSGLDRWLELAERHGLKEGLADQVQALTKMFTSGSAVLPTLARSRDYFVRLGEISAVLDASSSEVIECLSVVQSSTEQSVAAAESAMRRIKALLETTPPAGGAV